MKSNIGPKMLLIVTLVFLAGVLQAQESPRWSIVNPASTPVYQTGTQTATQPIREYIPSKSPRVIQTPYGVLVVNPNVRVHPSTVSDQLEVMIASNPANRSHLFGAAHTLRGSFLNAGVYVSTNNGASWFGWDTLQATNLNDQRGDPAPIIDKNGNLLYAHLTSATNFGSVTGIGVNRSTNNGVSFEATVSISGAGGSDADKELMGTDGNPASPYYGRSYVAWTKFTSGNVPGVILFSRTTDAGITWAAAQQVNTAASTTFSQGADVACGANGNIYICWAEENNNFPYPSQSIGFAKSTNGGTTWTFTNTAYATTGMRNFSFNGWDIRVNDFPRIAVDNTGGSRNGWIYIIAPEMNHTPAGSDADIIFHRSTDGGVTWSAGIRVNQDPLNNGKVQFFPAICVDGSGGINVSYYDNRNFPSVGDSCDMYMSRSLDGGSTWTDIQITDHHFKPKNASGVNSMGDYSGIAAGNGKVFPFWMDDITGKYQAYTAGVQTGVGVEVTLDQQREDGTRLTGTTVWRWNGSSFGTIAITSPPPTINSTVGSREVLRGYQQMVTSPSEKYRLWERNQVAQLDTVQNHRGFTLTSTDAELLSRFHPTHPTITIKTDLIDAPGTIGGNIQFRDPWYIDFPDPAYGNNLRNRGMTDAVYRDRSSPFYPDFNTPLGEQSYRGVFLNQFYDNPSNPYYSVGAPSQQIGNFTYNFVNWKTTQGAALFQNANAAQTGVVFQSANTTVAARMKAHLASTSATASAPNNQRKIVLGDYNLGLGIIYAGSGTIWGIGYDSSAPETPISAYPPVYTARDPSIDVQNEDQGYFHIVWEEVQGTYVHYIKYQKAYSDMSPAGAAETIHSWTSTSDYQATPVISFGKRLIGQASPQDTSMDIKYLIVAWRGDGRLQIATRQLVPTQTAWNVFAVPQTNASSTNPSVAAQVYPENLGSPSTYLVWQQINRIQFWTIRPSGNFATFYEFADISTNHSNNAAPSVTAVYRGDLNDPFHPVVAWHASGPLVDGPQTGVNDPTIISRERVGSVWQPYKQIQHGTHSMQYATISYDRLYSRLGVFFQCASHIGFADADPSDEGKWDGNWGWNPVQDLAANASSPNGTMAYSVWLSLWMPGGQSPYPITFAYEGGLSPRNLADMKPFAAARQSASITTDAKSANDRERGTQMKTESPAGSMVVQPHPSSRSGAVDLSRLEFPGWGPDVLRGIISFEATPHELVTQNGSERMRFAPADTLNLFAEWLGTEGVTVPASAQLLRSSRSVSISGFEVVTPPPASLNPVVFRLVLLNLEDGRTLKTLGEMRLKGLIALGRRDTAITSSFTLPLVQYRGRSVRVDFRIIGQEESFHPVFWETFFTPVEATTPLVPMASGRAQKPEARTVPTSYLLGQNFPNPFNPETIIRYELPEPSHVSIKLYDVLGREVMTLLDEPKEAGYYQISFDASRLSSGIYLYKMIAGTYVAAKKAVVMK